MLRSDAAASGPPTNCLLAALPAPVFSRLRRHLEPVALSFKDILHEPGQPITHLYFPTSGLISYLCATDERRGSIEVGVVGREGMTGLPILLDVEASIARSLVQIPGAALRIRAEKFRHVLHRDRILHNRLLRYVHVFLAHLTHCVACNSLHPVEKRLCRWLLTVHDRIGTDRFPLTHEFLAAMLGVRRATVTDAARRLRQGGLIHYGGGQLIVLDRQGLEATVCGCYRRVQEEWSRVLG
jgi:CRP-like cAMP-binding protein